MELLIDFDILNICKEFRKVILNEYNERYFRSILKLLNEEYEKFTIYPKKSEVFNAFKYRDLYDIKVVILGQDPYHNENQAHGLSFSVHKGCDIPSSLKNIFIELNSDINIKIPNHGNLISWANQGVLLLNSGLTVRKNHPNSHKLIGWSMFTDKIIKLLSSERENLVFVLWGNFAKKKESLIDKGKHLVLKSSHPSGLSAHKGFFSSKPFSKINKYLKDNSISEINWNIED